MLKRLILLLTLLLALPAVARPACHAPAAPAAQAMHHGATNHHAPTRDDAGMAHVCLGCVPPATLLSAPLDEPLRLRATLAAAPPSALSRGPSRAPTPPPPRAG